MVDTDDVRYNKEADGLLALINNDHLRLEGTALNAHNTYEVACKILRRRLGIDTFEVKKGKK